MSLTPSICHSTSTYTRHTVLPGDSCVHSLLNTWLFDHLLSCVAHMISWAWIEKCCTRVQIISSSSFGCSLYGSTQRVICFAGKPSPAQPGMEIWWFAYLILHSPGAALHAGLSVLPKDASTCGQEKVGIKPPTLWSIDGPRYHLNHSHPSEITLCSKETRFLCCY